MNELDLDYHYFMFFYKKFVINAKLYSTESLVPKYKRILTNSSINKFIRHSNTTFQKIYTDHYLNNTRYYEDCCVHESMVRCWKNKSNNI